MRKTKVGAWVVAGTLALSAGLAFAEEAPGPVVDDTTVEEVADDAVGDPSEEETDEVVDDATDATDEADEADEADEVADEADEAAEADETDETDGDAASHDNHGAVVSAAAHNHEHDEACGNHGAYVSHVARTGEEPACATAVSESTGDSTSDGDASAQSAKPRKTKTKGGRRG